MLPLTRRSRPLYGSIAFVLAALASPLALPSAQGASFLWDANLGTPGAQDGNGTWDTTATNWINGGNVAWSDGNDATFGASADGTYAVNVALTPSATSLVFNNSGYTLSSTLPTPGATITVTNAGASNAIFVGTGKTATIGSNVTVTTGTASANYTLAGGGTLIVDNGGVLKNAAGSSSNVLNINSSTVEVKTGGSLLTTSFPGNGNAIFVNGNLNVTGGTVDVLGTLGLGQSAAATAAAGVLTIDSGTVNAISSNGIRFGSATTDVISPGGAVNLNGGTLTATVIFEAAPGGIGSVSSSVFNFNGGTLKASTTAVSNFLNGLDHAYVKAGGAKIDTNGRNITIAQALEHVTNDPTDGGLTKSGGGTLILSGENTYDGPTSITGGALRLANSKALGLSTLASGNSAIQVQLSSSIDVTNQIRIFGAGPTSDGILKNIDGNNTLRDFGVSGTGGTRLNIFAGTLNLPNPISVGTGGGAQPIRVIGTGTLVLGGNNSAVLGSGTSFLLGAGGTAQGPVVQAGNNLAFGVATIDFQPGAKSTLASSDGTAHTFANNLKFSDTTLNQVTFGAAGTGDLTFTGNLAMSGNSQIAVQNSTTTLSGAISGTASLTKVDTGTLVLDGANANTFSGGTTVSAGVLDVKKSGGLGTGDVFVSSGATLKLELAVGNNYISDSGRLLLAAGTPVVQLNFTGTADTVAALSFDGGATFATPGIWGSPTSGAQFTSPLFSGSGTLNVLSVPEPNTAALFAACSMLLGLRRRRVRISSISGKAGATH